MDMSKSIEPKSDQQNYDDYIAGPRTVTVSQVKKGSAEQPVEIHLVEYPGRAYKPSKSMRRVLVSGWGPDAAAYVGRRLRLYGDPTVMFGKEAVGGIKISHMSHLPRPMQVQLTVSRGRREPFVVERLPVDVDLTELLAGAETVEDLQQAWGTVQQAGEAGNPELVALKDARKEELTDAPAEG